MDECDKSELMRLLAELKRRADAAERAERAFRAAARAVIRAIERSNRVPHQPSGTGHVVGDKAPTVLLGFGLERETFRSLAERCGKRGARWLPLRTVFEVLQPDVPLADAMASVMETEEFRRQIRERRAFVLYSGSAHLIPCEELDGAERLLELLGILAKKTLRGEEPVVEDSEYSRPAAPTHRGLAEGHPSLGLDRETVDDFVTERVEDAPPRLRSGVQIIRPRKPQPALKAAITRLRDALATCGLGPRHRLLESIGHGAYRAGFALDVILRPIDKGKHMAGRASTCGR